MRKLVRWAFALCASMLLAVVAASGANADSVNAVVVGKALRCGSPGHGFRHRACDLQRRVVVSVFDGRHQLVATESITNGHFSFALTAGRYSLSARRPNGTSARRPVVVSADETKRTTIIFNIPDTHR